jgi:hypothetical protein
MTLPAPFQQVVHSRLFALSVSDGFARAIHIAGDFPPLLGEVACEIVAQTVPVARTFDPPLALTSFRNASGFVIIDGTYARSDIGRRTIPLGPGTYRVRVAGEYYQPAEVLISWPPAEGETRIPPAPGGHRELLPGPLYPVPDVTASRYQLAPTIVRGTLFTTSGAPIEGATVEIVNLPAFLAPAELPALLQADWPFLKATSSATGDWVLVLPSRRYLDNTAEIPPNPNPLSKVFDLRLTIPNSPVINLQRQIEYGREFSLRQTALRGQVSGSSGRPIAGATIATSVNGLTTTSRPNGLWFLYFDFDQATVNNVTVTATTPSGASTTDPTAHVEHDATTVVPTFHFS